MPADGAKEGPATVGPATVEAAHRTYAKEPPGTMHISKVPDVPVK